MESIALKNAALEIANGEVCKTSQINNRRLMNMLTTLLKALTGGTVADALDSFAYLRAEDIPMAPPLAVSSEP